ncbi:hypothetical protein PHLGIDRAFT_57966, partial [Phlebiopsis gigantea 11061_1 CR5-6]
MSEVVLGMTSHLYSTHYISKQRVIPKTKKQMALLLGVWKEEFPDIFRSFVRVTPACFDSLLHAIQPDPIFHNNSNNEQMPLSEQLAIALIRFGHYGNGASVRKIALWAGVGFGTVDLATFRVIIAVCREDFRRACVRWPNQAQKEEAKVWVEERSCPAWRDGWCMVDGTLVPLFMRPGYFGNTFYDRKSNYSLNVQLVSTPDLRIIDYSVGLPGSQHDATAWADTRIFQEHNSLLAENEWVWADSAYPVTPWTQAPYKK